MEFRILGPLEVSGADGPIKLGGPKQRAVLAHLILQADRPVPVERLIDRLWDEEPPETAKNTLQTYVYRLRQVLGDDRISSERGGYVLRADAAEIDAARFEAMVRAAKADLHTHPSKAAAALAEALSIWRGAPLADLSIDSNITQLRLAGAAPKTPAIEAWSRRMAALEGVQRSNEAVRKMIAT